MRKRVDLKIYGQVQGVFFRAKAKEKADELVLVGWIKNEPDGTVQIIAEGPEENLKKFIQWCYTGVKNARADMINVEWEEASGKFEKFEIRY